MNLRPHGPEPCALPNCATPRGKNIEFSNSGQNCGQPPFLRGFETTRSRFFSVFLAFSRFFEGGRSERPLAPEPCALPNCATPRNSVLGNYIMSLNNCQGDFCFLLRFSSQVIPSSMRVKRVDTMAHGEVAFLKKLRKNFSIAPCQI